MAGQDLLWRHVAQGRARTAVDDDEEAERGHVGAKNGREQVFKKPSAISTVSTSWDSCVKPDTIAYESTSTAPLGEHLVH
uniref:Uncharacterized protein n=1 Tax=Trichuris muris TaxID=70415 RepID=A0A5S6QYA7_TRIMR